jgi:hypothetical protein
MRQRAGRGCAARAAHAGHSLRALLLAAIRAEFIAESARLVHRYYARKKNFTPAVRLRNTPASNRGVMQFGSDRQPEQQGWTTCGWVSSKGTRRNAIGPSGLRKLRPDQGASSTDARLVPTRTSSKYSTLVPVIHPRSR